MQNQMITNSEPFKFRIVLDHLNIGLLVFRFPLYLDSSCVENKVRGKPESILKTLVSPFNHSEASLVEAQGCFSLF